MQLEKQKTKKTTTRERPSEIFSKRAVLKSLTILKSPQAKILHGLQVCFIRASPWTFSGEETIFARKLFRRRPEANCQSNRKIYYEVAKCLFALFGFYELYL